MLKMQQNQKFLKANLSQLSSSRVSFFWTSADIAQ